MTEPPPPPDDNTKSCCAQTREQVKQEMSKEIECILEESRKGFNAVVINADMTSKSYAEEVATLNNKLATSERRILELEKALRKKEERADADAAIDERDDALDRLRRESGEKNKIIASQTSRLEATLRQLRESEARAKKQSETTAVTKPRARKGRAPVPLAWQKEAVLTMARQCYFAQAFALEPLPDSGPLNELRTFSVEVGALQRCLRAAGKETCVRLCRAGLAALREIQAQVLLLLAAGEGMRQLLDYMRGGAAPWGAYSCNSGSQYVLMQRSLALVTAFTLVGYPMDKPLKITNIKEFYQFLLCIRKGDMHTPPRDGCIKFALYHIVRPKVPDFPWDFDSDIAQWNMPLHDYLAEFMAEVGS